MTPQEPDIQTWEFLLGVAIALITGWAGGLVFGKCKTCGNHPATKPRRDK